MRFFTTRNPRFYDARRALYRSNESTTVYIVDTDGAYFTDTNGARLVMPS